MRGGLSEEIGTDPTVVELPPAALEILARAATLTGEEIRLLASYQVEEILGLQARYSEDLNAGSKGFGKKRLKSLRRAARDAVSRSARSARARREGLGLVGPWRRMRAAEAVSAAALADAERARLTESAATDLRWPWHEVVELGVRRVPNNGLRTWIPRLVAFGSIALVAQIAVGRILSGGGPIGLYMEPLELASVAAILSSCPLILVWWFRATIAFRSGASAANEAAGLFAHGIAHGILASALPVVIITFSVLVWGALAAVCAAIGAVFLAAVLIERRRGAKTAVTLAGDPSQESRPPAEANDLRMTEPDLRRYRSFGDAGLAEPNLGRWWFVGDDPDWRRGITLEDGFIVISVVEPRRSGIQCWVAADLTLQPWGEGRYRLRHRGDPVAVLLPTTGDPDRLASALANSPRPLPKSPLPKGPRSTLVDSEPRSVTRRSSAMNRRSASTPSIRG